MGLITKSKKITPRGTNISYYKNLGYVFNSGDEIEIPVHDLPKGSNELVECTCDYCHKLISMTFSNYNIIMSKPIKKIACLDCTYIKRKESNILIYGVENTSSLQSSKDKTKETCLQKYGTDSVLKSSIVKEKIKNTNLKRYGVKNVFASPDIKDKIKNTNISKYNVPIPSQNPRVIQKMKNTMFEKYGVTNSMFLEEIKQKIKETNMERYGVTNSAKCSKVRKKTVETLYKNQSVATSKQQLYIQNLYGGELNGVVSYYNCDIVFKDEKLVVEIDFGGHNLSVKLGNITESEFKQKEIVRDQCIKREGYRIMRIISRQDYLPSDTTLLNMLQYARDFFASNPDRSWINFDIDNNVIYNAYYKESSSGLFYDYGKLRKIKTKRKEEQQCRMGQPQKLSLLTT